MPSNGLPWVDTTFVEDLPQPEPPQFRTVSCAVCGGAVPYGADCYWCAQAQDSIRGFDPDPYEEDGAPETVRSTPQSDEMFTGTILYAGSFPSWPDSFPPAWDNILERIEALKAGDTPRNSFEQTIFDAIERNKKRDAEESAAREAIPSRFERV